MYFLIVFGVFEVVLVEVEVNKDVLDLDEFLIDKFIPKCGSFHGLRVPLIRQAHEG